MKLVVGLGNPGTRYAETRHNIGFMVVAKLLTMTAAGASKTKFSGEISEGQVAGHRISILRPGTYMNASGQSVRQALDYYKIEPADVLVVCDDMNLPLGQIRIRGKGSSGGQKGLADIIRHLGTENVPRLRIGIDPAPPGWEVPDYVLSKFKRSEQDEVERSTTEAAHAALLWLTDGITVCMNQYNVKKPSK